MNETTSPISRIAESIAQNARVFVGIWLTIVLLVILFKGIIPGWNNQTGDFNNYYTAAALVMEGKEIEQFYDNTWFSKEAHDMGISNGAKFAPFPPLTAFIMTPIASFNHDTARWIWLIINGLILLLLPFRLQRLSDLNLLWTAAITGLFFVPLIANLYFGQVYLLLTFVLIEALLLGLVKNRRKLAAGMIAIVALFKYFPILFSAYLFGNRKSKTFASSIFNQKWMVYFIGTLLIVIISTYIAYPKSYQAYLGVFNNHLQGNLSGQGSHAIAFQSIDSMLNNLFLSNSPGATQYPVLKTSFKALFFLGIGWCFFKILQRDQFRFSTINSSIFMFGAFVLIPASASYHFLFLLIPTLFIFDWLAEQKNNTALVLFSILLLATLSIQYHHIPTIHFSSNLNDVVHYPRLWCLVILFGYLTHLKLRTRIG